MTSAHGCNLFEQHAIRLDDVRTPRIELAGIVGERATSGPGLPCRSPDRWLDDLRCPPAHGRISGRRQGLGMVDEVILIPIILNRAIPARW